MMTLPLQISSYDDMRNYSRFLGQFRIFGFVSSPSFVAPAEDILTIFGNSPSQEFRLHLPKESEEELRGKSICLYLRKTGLTA